METNKFKRAWIWFWYNDITRIAILLGAYLPLIAVLLLWVGVKGETVRAIVMLIYLFFIAWAMVDNDYSNLRKIGLDEYRNKL